MVTNITHSLPPPPPHTHKISAVIPFGLSNMPVAGQKETQPKTTPGAESPLDPPDFERLVHSEFLIYFWVPSSFIT